MASRRLSVLVTCDVDTHWNEDDFRRLVEQRLRNFGEHLVVENYRKPADVGDLIDPTNMSAEAEYRSPKEIMAETVAKFNEEKARIDRESPPPFGGLPDPKTYFDR